MKTTSLLDSAKTESSFAGISVRLDLSKEIKIKHYRKLFCLILNDWKKVSESFEGQVNDIKLNISDCNLLSYKARLYKAFVSDAML